MKCVLIFLIFCFVGAVLFGICGFTAQKRCADLIVSEVQEPDWNADSNATQVIVEIKNIGRALSERTKAKLSDFDPSVQDLKRMNLESTFRSQLYKSQKALENDLYFEKILDVPELRPKESVQIIFTINNFWVYDPICELVVEVNFNGEAKECREGNNSKHFLSSI